MKVAVVPGDDLDFRGLKESPLERVGRVISVQGWMIVMLTPVALVELEDVSGFPDPGLRGYWDAVTIGREDRKMVMGVTTRN